MLLKEFTASSRASDVMTPRLTPAWMWQEVQIAMCFTACLVEADIHEPGPTQLFYTVRLCPKASALKGTAYLKVRLEAGAACLPAGVPHEARVAVAEVARSPLIALLQQPRLPSSALEVASNMGAFVRGFTGRTQSPWSTVGAPSQHGEHTQLTAQAAP